MAEFKHGSMDIKEQEKTYHGFMKFAMYGAISAMLFLLFLGLVNG